MTVEFICKKHGARTPKNAKAGGLAVDLVCDICGEKCECQYVEFPYGALTKEQVYPEIYGENK